jgi:circadian clock protein KaiB
MEPQMQTKRKKAKKSVAAATTVVVMRLYVAGSAPNSALAIANLESICKRYLKSNYELEIVDVFEEPQRALAEGVVVTPSLSKLSPIPASKVVGNLSDEKAVLLALGLKGKKK